MNIKDERGFLLAELTVTLALLVVVLAVSSVFFFFCQRSFYEGEKKTIVQSNVRLAANYITKEVRYADNIIAYATSDVGENIKEDLNISDDTTYYCLKLDNGILQEVITDESGDSIRAITLDARIDTLAFDFITNEGKHFLSFTITGSDESEHTRTITSEVLLVNIKKLPTELVDNPDNHYTTIYFTKAIIPS